MSKRTLKIASHTDYYLYVLYLHNAIEINGVFKYVIKIGTTLYPEYRKWASSTYSPNPPMYLHIFKFAADQFKNNPKNLYDLDNKKFPEFLIQNRLEVHICNGGGTEWYIKDGWDYVAILHRFFEEQGLTILEQYNDDPYQIRPPTEQTRSKLDIEDNRIISSKQEMSLKRKFFNTFLPQGSSPRRNQEELWNILEILCDQPQPFYKGIIQWATGTGKTIALLMLFVMFSEATKRNGAIFRGLLISPRNDIFHTIIHHIHKLSKWGITVCEGHNGKLSSLSIPLDKPVIITATHASLTDSIRWDKLPIITHAHYDEVHRITGEEFHIRLQQKLEVWNTPFLTGTSATPKTCNLTQHKRLTELFGNPLSILHRCDVDEAIQEGWIAVPRFGVHVLSNKLKRNIVIRHFVDVVHQSILEKQTQQLWKGGKVIVYLPSIKEVCEAVAIAKECMPDWHIYTAVEDVSESAVTDDQFIRDEADGQPRILFACERYREGSDIKGLEMTIVLMGNTIAAYILLQIAGRAVRLDHIGKEGWCVIVRPSDEGTTEDEVFDSIVLDIMEFIGSDDISPSKEKIKRVVEQFFGSVAISGKIYHVEETIQRIQAMYARKAFERADPKEKYEVIRALNRDMGLRSRHEYSLCSTHHPKYVMDPKAYFKDQWVSWYHFLGVDTSSFPQTKTEWTARWKQMGIRSWEEYTQKNSSLLPANPGEMYESYTNPIAEFNEEEDEIVW